MPNFEQPPSNENSARERLLARLREELGPETEETTDQMKAERDAEMEQMNAWDVTRIATEADEAVAALEDAIEDDDALEMYAADLRLKGLADLLSEKGNVASVGDASLGKLTAVVRERIDEVTRGEQDRGARRDAWENLER